MSDPKRIRNLDFAIADDEGTSVSLVLRDESDGTNLYVMPTTGLPELLLDIISVAGHPKVKEHLQGIPDAQPDSNRKLVFLPYEKIGAGFVEATGTIGLIIGVSGAVHFGLALTQELAAGLCKSLEDARFATKYPRNQTPLN